MAMSSKEILTLIQEHFPDATIDLKDLAGDGDHYAISITSALFKGLSRVRQHQLVYEALGGRMGGELHALSIQTKAS